MNSVDQAVRFIEYLKNPIQLIEDEFKVQDNTQGGYVPFKVFPKQRELLEKYENGTHVIVNKPRQAGISTVTAAYIAAIVALADKKNPHKIIIVANKAAQAQDFLAKIKDFLSQVPVWLWGENYDHNKELDGHIIGKGSVKTLKLLNGCNISAVATSKDAIRGASSPRIIVIDEAAHIDKVDNETMFASAMMALSSNLNGQMFLISTPNSTDPIFYQTYSDTINTNGNNKFTIHELYFFQDPRYNKNLTWSKKVKGEDDLIEIEREFDNEKMVEKYKKGWMPNSDWFREQCAILHEDKVQINRELLCKFEGSGHNVIDFEHTNRHEQNYVCEPIRKEYNGDLWIFEEPIKGHEYVAFVDVASPEGKDFSSLQILNTTTGNQAAELKAKVKSEDLAVIVKDTCERYNALTDIDTTGGYGDNLLSDLIALNFKLLNCEDPNDYNPKGFKFSGINRPKLFQKFISYIESDQFKIKSARMIIELKTFKWVNGRPDHMRGFNDDAICAYAGAIWLFEMFFKNIRKAEAQNKAILNVWLGITNDEQSKDIKTKPKFNGAMYQNGVDITSDIWILGY